MFSQETWAENESVQELVRFALEILPGMYNTEQSLFCTSRDALGRQEGFSERYTLICLIGLHYAQKMGHTSPFDLDLLYDTVARRSSDNVADLGLQLWAGTLLNKEDLQDVCMSLGRGLEEGRLQVLTGMELGLALSGLTAYAVQSGLSNVFQMARNLKAFILQHLVHPKSGLFFHCAGSIFRKSFPNFATQVYLMHGLAQYARATGEQDAIEVATACADSLCRLQQPDGGWPWVYRASGSVTEAYEVYSVHQDAMMPMAFLEVGEVARRDYREPVERSLQWLYGKNELKVNMIDPSAQLIYRSLRRRYPFNKVVLGIHTLRDMIFHRPFPSRSGLLVEVNRTCRPYHPGWILYAWCGRKEALKSAIGDR